MVIGLHKLRHGNIYYLFGNRFSHRYSRVEFNSTINPFVACVTRIDPQSNYQFIARSYLFRVQLSIDLKIFFFIDGFWNRMNFLSF